MPWEYSQHTGEMKLNGQFVGKGYSGFGPGKDKPEMEALSNIGPIPRGIYTIGAARQHPSKGPVVMSLTPVAHNAQGRTHFLIHGESRRHPGQASQGCIILGLPYRQRVSISGDKTLMVVE
jgi:hypothetical protein